MNTNEEDEIRNALVSRNDLERNSQVHYSLRKTRTNSLNRASKSRPKSRNKNDLSRSAKQKQSKSQCLAKRKSSKGKENARGKENKVKLIQDFLKKSCPKKNAVHSITPLKLTKREMRNLLNSVAT